MNSQESGYYSQTNRVTFEPPLSPVPSHEVSEFDLTLSPLSSVDYDHEVDRILQLYEDAAKDEKQYLLHTTFKTGAFQISCGISPARTLSCAIILSQANKLEQLSFGTYEWATLIEMLQNTTFFIEPLDQYPDEYDPVRLPCGDFCTVTQLVFDDTRFLEVRKQGIYFYLAQEDVTDILHIDRCLISHRLSMLDNLGFCAYYRNVIDLVRTYVNMNSNLSKLELLYAFCEASTDSLLCSALREYIYFYKHIVVNDLENI